MHNICIYIYEYNYFNLIIEGIISSEKMRNSGNYNYDYHHSFFGKDFQSKLLYWYKYIHIYKYAYKFTYIIMHVHMCTIKHSHVHCMLIHGDVLFLRIELWNVIHFWLWCDCDLWGRIRFGAGHFGAGTIGRLFFLDSFFCSYVVSVCSSLRSR